MKHALKLLIGILVFLCCANCQKSLLHTHKSPAQEKYLHLASISDVRSLEPYIAIDYPSAHVTKMLLEGLLILGPGGKILPGIAQRYEVSEDKKIYTFYLRSAKWSNGDEVTAYDFEYSWKKILNPINGSIGAQNLFCIRNAHKAFLKETPLDSVGIYVLDKKTLRVELEHPTHYFEELTASPSYLPVNAKIDQENPNWAIGDKGNYVGNGPFLLEKHRPENELVVKKNPTYWNAEQVRLSGISIIVIKESSTLINLFEKKKIDWLGNPFFPLPFETIAHLKKTKQMHILDDLGAFWLFLNTQTSPFKNKKIRKAFCYSINRDLLINHVVSNGETPATTILPYHLSTQKNPFFRDNDPKYALQLLREGLQELGIQKEDLNSINFSHTMHPNHAILAQAIQDQWREVLGVNVKLNHTDFAAHLHRLTQGDYQIGSMSYHSWLRDPIYILQSFKDQSSSNLCSWLNKDYQNYIELGEKQVDPVKRLEYLHEAEKLIMEEMPIIPIYFSKIFYMKNEKLKNVYISDLYLIDFRWAYFEE